MSGTDADALMVSNDAALVLLLTPDRDACNLFPLELIPRQKLVQIRELRPAYVSFCDAAEVVSTAFTELAPECAELAGPPEFWLRPFSTIPEEFRRAVFVCWCLLYLRTEFSRLQFWAVNLEGVERNPRID